MRDSKPGRPGRHSYSIFSRYVDVSLSGSPGTDEKKSKGCEKLFVLGGRAPDTEWLFEFAVSNGFDVWAIDSGAASCRAASLSPRAIIGDMDSASRDDWNWAVAEGANEHLYDCSKDLTDFQLALDLLSREDAGSAPILTGCFGGRADHFLSVVNTYVGIGLSGKQPERSLYETPPRCMIDDREGIFLVYSFETAVFRFRHRPVAVSLLSMSEKCDGVFISGVRWPLSDVVLERNFPWAICNETEGESAGADEVSVSCGEGILAVSWCYYR